MFSVKIVKQVFWKIVFCSKGNCFQQQFPNKTFASVSEWVWYYEVYGISKGQLLHQR